jgi:hypothetical protein
MSVNRRYSMKIHIHPRRRALPVFAALAITVTAAGCGGNDETLSKAEVIKRASAICTTQEGKVRALPQLTSENPFAKGAPKGEREKARRFLGGYAEALQTVRTQLAELKLPDEDKEKFESFLDELGPTVQKLREAEQAAGRGDSRALTLANEGFGLFEQASKHTAAYGFPKDVCGA